MTPSEQTAREIAKEIVTSSGLTMTERDMIISVELVKKITEALERERRELELIKKEIKPHENLDSYIKEWEELDDERIARIKELEAKLKAAEAEVERLRAENESHKKFCESILTSPPQAVKETESVILICSKCGKDCDDLGEHIFCNKCLDKMIPEPSPKKAEREEKIIKLVHARSRAVAEIEDWPGGTDELASAIAGIA